MRRLTGSRTQGSQCFRAGSAERTRGARVGWRGEYRQAARERVGTRPSTTAYHRRYSRPTCRVARAHVTFVPRRRDRPRRRLSSRAVADDARLDPATGNSGECSSAGADNVASPPGRSRHRKDVAGGARCAGSRGGNREQKRRDRGCEARSCGREAPSESSRTSRRHGRVPIRQLAYFSEAGPRSDDGLCATTLCSTGVRSARDACSERPPSSRTSSRRSARRYESDQEQAGR
jgi:hypothetical protein